MIKVGMYCRTEKGIGKIEEIRKYKDEFIIKLDCGILIDDTGFTEEEMIKRYKISNSIINLIEIRDYVNGLLVMKVHKTYVEFENGICNVEYIKSIVTKEEFKNMEYKL